MTKDRDDVPPLTSAGDGGGAAAAAAAAVVADDGAVDADEQRGGESDDVLMSVALTVHSTADVGAEVRRVAHGMLRAQAWRLLGQYESQNSVQTERMSRLSWVLEQAMRS